MFKLIILIYASANIEAGPIGMIEHPWEFNDAETCEEFKSYDNWSVRANKNFIAIDAECRKVAEGA